MISALMNFDIKIPGACSAFGQKTPATVPLWGNPGSLNPLRGGGTLINGFNNQENAV